jgi:hypothetical protein
MHSRENINPIISTRRDYTWGIGVVLVTVGVILFIDQYLKTGWLSLMILPVSGLILLIWGILSRKLGLIIPGSILFSLGIGGFLSLSHVLQLEIKIRVGLLLVIFSLGWVMISIFSYLFAEKIYWWPLVPSSLLFGFGVCFLVSWQAFNFVLFPTIGLGLAFLIWGFGSQLIGLVIPGSILLGIGPGIYFAWKEPAIGNGLTQSGIMLVCFAIGWGLITIFSRILVDKFIWWPLIPGGILAMTGWGLYIGGNPQNALSFIGNTTSVGLILFGLYLMLWRSGIKK